MKRIILIVILLLIFVSPAIAQDFNSSKAYSDYIFTEDTYKTRLTTFNLKKDSYQKNSTLSLKEESRLALLDFLSSRDDLVKNYLTLVRIKTLESEGLNIVDKQNVYSKLDPEVLWFDNQKNNYTLNDTLENLVTKSQEEDKKYQNETVPVIYYSLATLSRGEVIRLKNEHLKIYDELKNEANNLVTLGRADSELFDRWFKDIDKELENLSKVEREVQTEIDKIFGADEYLRDSGYKKAIEALEPARASLLKLNRFLMELETTINTKR